MKILIALVGLLPAACFSISTENRYIGASEAGKIVDLRYVSSHNTERPTDNSLIFADGADNDFRYCRAIQAEAPENDVIECMHIESASVLIKYKRKKAEENQHSEINLLLNKMYGENWLYFDSFSCISGCSKASPRELFEALERENEDIQ